MVEKLNGTKMNQNSSVLGTTFENVSSQCYKTNLSKKKKIIDKTTGKKHVATIMSMF